MKWYFIGILALVAAVAGFFIYPYVYPCEVQDPPQRPAEFTFGPVKPDTVIVTKTVYERVPVYVTRQKVIRDTIFNDRLVVDTIYVDREKPVFKSTAFFSDDYYTNLVWAWSSCPVDSFQSDVRIEFDRYFNDVYGKKIKKSHSWSPYLKGGLFGFCIGTLAFTLAQ